MELRLKQSTIIAPTQSRTIPVSIQQSEPFYGDTIEVEIVLVAGPVTERVTACLAVVHKAFDSQEHKWVQGTFFFADSMPSLFQAIIPAVTQTLNTNNVFPILALRSFIPVHRKNRVSSGKPIDGAGVDIIQEDFWVKSLPNNWASWIIVPVGRTSWVNLLQQIIIHHD